MDIAGLIISLLPLIVVFLGIVLFKKSGSVMVIVALVLTAFLAWWYFHTDLDIILRGIIMGILKSFGISIAIVFAMFLVFLMQNVGALKRISEAVDKVAGTKEEKALFVGMGFGSFVTALGLVTPTLFPPLLVAMGFTPLAAIAIATLGYDPLCSFALLSLPITAPADTVAGMHLAGIGTFTAQTFATNISIFLPVISVLFAFAMLWITGGIGAIKRSWVPALLSGLVISLSALALVYFNIVPLSIVGVVAGALSMTFLYIYNTVRAAVVNKISVVPALVKAAILIVLICAVMVDFALLFNKNTTLEYAGLALLFIGLIAGAVAYVLLGRKNAAKVAADGGTKVKSISLLRSLSPWIILILLVSLVGIPTLATYLNNLPGSAEVIVLYTNQKVDLNFLTQAYTWILVASVIGIFTMGASKAQVSQALNLTVKRFLGPFLAYSLFFSIAYLMFFSGGSVVNGAFTPTANPSMNMDMIIGATLAAVFGTYYGLVAPIPGLIGSVVGGSETSSNVMFAKIQHVAVSNTIGADKFGLAYGSLAVAGGIASAITPSKIHNACATLGEGGKTESEVMKINIWVAIGLTLVTAVMTFLFLKVGIGF